MRTGVSVCVCVCLCERERNQSCFLHQLVFIWSTTVGLFLTRAHGFFHSILQRLSGHKQPHNVFLLVCQSFPCPVVHDHGHVPAVHLVRRGGGMGGVIKESHLRQHQLKSKGRKRSHLVDVNFITHLQYFVTHH